MSKTEDKMELVSDNEEEEVQPVNLGVCLFSNIMGVTCYINATLQILQQTPYFKEYITQYKFRDTLMKKCALIQNKEEFLKNNVIIELYRLFKVSLENDNISITPTSFREAVGKKNDMWIERSQQDSQEFFNFLISQLEEEAGMKCSFIPGGNLDFEVSADYDPFKIINSTKSWIQYQAREYSPLKNMFNGLTQNTRRCSCCGNINDRYEPYVTMGLSIPIDIHNMNKSYSIYECLDNMVHEEQLDSDNMYDCDMCGLKNQGYSKIQLWQTPKILVLHLKRFMVNKFGIPTRKLNNNIIYPITNLDLSKYFDPSSPFKENSKYDLYAVNIHHAFGGGQSINFGHYTALVKNTINHNWYHYNDSSPAQLVTYANQLQTDQAYMLFYIRCD
jgi:ubiquitin carboxyl-terminal hydrolase 8